MAFNAAIFTGMGKAARRRQQEERTQREARGATLLGIWKDLVQSPNATPELVSHGTRNMFQLATADPGDPKSFNKVLKNTGKLDIFTEGIQPTTVSGVSEAMGWPKPMELPGVSRDFLGPQPKRTREEVGEGVVPRLPFSITHPEGLPGFTVQPPSPRSILSGPSEIVEAMRISPFKTQAQKMDEARQLIEIEAERERAKIKAQEIPAPFGLPHVEGGTPINPLTLRGEIDLMGLASQAATAAAARDSAQANLVYQQLALDMRQSRTLAAAMGRVEFTQNALDSRAAIKTALDIEMQELPTNLTTSLSALADEYKMLTRIKEQLPFLEGNVGGLFGANYTLANLQTKVGTLPPEEAAALSLVGQYVSTKLNRLSGAAVSPAEYTRILESSPDPSITWDSFIGRLDESISVVEEFMANRLRTVSSPINQVKVLTVLGNVGVPQVFLGTIGEEMKIATPFYTQSMADAQNPPWTYEQARQYFISEGWTVQ